MYDADIPLEVSICRRVLVVGARRGVVGKADPLPWAMFKVLIKQTLICAVEAVSCRCQSLQRMVLAHVWCNDHDTSVEGIGPANVWCCCEGLGDVEQLFGRSQRDDVCVNVYDLAELRLAP